VYNVGDFTMHGGYICKNTCVDMGTSSGLGGGVYNVGTFTMSAGDIYENTATSGGGVYNVGVFDRNDDVLTRIYANTALSGEGVDVFIETIGSGQFYVLVIVGVIVAGIVVGLLFYRSKKRKQGAV
jgi:hypothetical protein